MLSGRVFLRPRVVWSAAKPLRSLLVQLLVIHLNFEVDHSTKIFVCRSDWDGG